MDTSGRGTTGEILGVFDRTAAPCTPLTTGEVADELETSRDAAVDHLERLVAAGDLASRTVGDDEQVWWRSPGTEELSDERAENDDLDDLDGDRDRPFARLVENVPGMVYRCRNEEGWPMSFVSSDCEELTGYDPSAVEEGAVSWGRDVVHPEDRDAVRTAVASGLAEDGQFTVQYRVLTDDGETRWVWERGCRVDGSDDPAVLEGVITDVTDQKEVEERLRDERDLLERILTAVPVSIGVVGPDGEFVRANDRAEERLGTALLSEERDGVGERDVYDEDGEYVPPEDRPHLQAFETGESVRDWRCQTDLPDHGRRWLSINAEPLVDDDGEVERVVVCGDDVTRLQEQTDRLERERDELAAELDEVYERVTDAFFAVDDEWRFTHVNDTARAVLDVDESTVLGESIWDVFPEATDGQFWDGYHEAMAAQEPVHFEEYYAPLATWFEVHAYPSESGLSVYFRDVTERKERERELKRTEVLFEESRDVNAVLDEDGTFRYLTPSSEHVLGYEPAELVGENVFEYVHPEDREETVEKFTTVVREPERDPHAEFRFRHADGSWVALEARGRNLLDEPEIGGIVAYTRDVTERREHEAFLRDLYGTTATADLSFEEKLGELLELGRERFGRDVGFLSRIGDGTLEVVEAVGDDRFASGTAMPVSETYCRHLLEADGPTVIEDAPAEGMADDPARERHGLDCYLGTRVTVDGELYGTLCFVSDEAADRSFTETEQTLLELMSEWLSHELQHRQNRDRLARLHESSRELFRTGSDQSVGQHVVEAASRVIDVPGALAYRHDPDADALTLDAATDDYDAPREVPLESDGLFASAFAAGEPRYVADVEAVPGLGDGDGFCVNGALLVPMGDRGLLVAGDRTTAEFGDSRRSLLEILAANAAAAYDRVDRERELELATQRYRTLAEYFPGGAVGVFDEDLVYTDVEGAIWDDIGPDASVLQDAHVTQALPPEAAADLEPLFADALDGEVGSVETDFAGRTFEVWAMPMRASDGELLGGVSFSVDVTDRIDRQRELEWYERIVENLPVGVYRNTPGPDGEFVEVNETLADIFDADSVEEMLDVDVSDLYTDPEERAEFSRTLDEEGVVEEYEIEQRTLDGRTIWIAVTAIAVEEDGERYFDGIVQDVTERVERERELEQYETIVSTMRDGVYVLDEEFRFDRVNDAYVAMTGYDREELLGAHCSLVVDDDVVDASADRLEAVLAGAEDSGTIEADVLRKDGSTTRAESRFTGLPDADGTGDRKVGVVRDVSERVERERELETRVRQQAAVTELGRLALEDRELDDLMAVAAERVAETLDNDYCKVLELDQEADELLLRQGIGWDDGVVGEATVSAVADDSQAAYTLASAAPVRVTDLETEERFGGPDLLTDHDVASGVSVVIGPDDDPWGILGTHDTDAREFSDQDVNFVQSVANILASAIDRHQHERELVQQRKRLAALNDLNAVVREINDAVVEQSTREEIERTVCEHLADSDAYAFAWTCELDPKTDSIEPRFEAGADGSVDEVELSTNPDEPGGRSLTGQAIRTGRMQVTTDVASDHIVGPWREVARDRDVESSAAIPIVHEGTVYGALSLYAARRGAFTREERAVVAQLGEMVGHAIAATERKQALMSDDLVEVEFRMDDVLGAVGVDRTMGGQVAIEDTVALADGEYLVYGRTTGDGDEVLDVLADRVDHWSDATLLDEPDDEDGGDRRFELRLEEPPVLSAVAAHGGYVESAVIDGGDYHVVIHLPPSIDVRRIVDTVKETYPGAELVTRRQVTRDETRSNIEDTLAEELTDRQRTALEASFHAGFFEWPRESSGEEVAESLDVSAPTFHQHLRKAQQKVLASVLG